MRCITQNDDFTYRVSWSDEDHEYVALCTQFPSMSWLAATPELALAGMQNLVEYVVADMEQNAERHLASE